jgi:hypothetical protein
MPVDVEISGAAMTPSSHGVGEFTERRQVAGFVKRHAVRERKTFSGECACRDVA